MGTVFEIFANLLEAVIATQFYMRYFGCKEKYNKWFAACAMVALHFVTISIINNISFFTLYGEYIYSLLWIIVSIILLKGKVLEKIFVRGLYDVYFNLIVLVFYSFFDKWITYGQNGYMVFGFARVIMVLVAKAMDVIFYEFLIRYREKENVLIDNTLYAGLISMVYATSVAEKFLLSIYYNSSYDNRMHQDAMLVTIALVAIDMIVYIMCVNLSKSNIELVKERMKNAAYESRMNNVQAAKELHEKTLKIKHDMKNELLNIKMKIKEAKFEEADEYIEKTLNVKLASAHIIFTENMLVDAVINKCIEKCKEKNISIKTVIESSIGNIAEMDMAILLSNLLDNAIEAAEKTDEKKIEFNMHNDKDYLCVLINNSHNGSIVESEVGMSTTKSDKLFHGYGLSNVKDIVKKYNGNYYTDAQKSIFVTSIGLQIE